MAGGGGYLSQVVRDARPRAAPSLYVGGPAVASAARDAPGYARLMDGQPAVPTPEAAPPQGAAQVPPAPQVPAHSTDDEDPAQTPTRVATQSAQAGPTQYHGSAQIHPEPSEHSTPTPLETADPPDTPGAELSEVEVVTPRVQVSGTRPRPTTMDMPAHAATPPNGPASPTDPQTAPSPHSRADVPAPEATEPTPTIHTPAPQALAQQPRINDAAAARTRDRAATKPTARSATASNNMRSPGDRTEVHIGQVEVIVQDPPAPRAPAAPRAAPKAPSPARYHVRRF
ncbi:MAG: hypothetical protein AAFP16_14130 [Pseudomonadota bacterium]